MHTNFADWYRIAGVEPGADWLPKRWTGIAEYSPPAVEIIELVRFFFQRDGATAASIAKFQEALQKADPTFKMRDNDQELRVLAGAALVDLMERGEFVDSYLAALALVCMSAQNLRKRPCVPEIPEIAARTLRKATLDRKLPENLTGVSAEVLEEIAGLGAPHDKLAEEFRKTQAEMPLLSEEVNMLWWLFAAHSRDENKPWADYSVGASALMIGKELADLTQVLPGPVAAHAFLDRAIKSGRPKQPSTVEIREAVNEALLEWRKKVTATAAPAILEDLLAITAAIKLSVVSPNSDEWVPPFVSKTGIPKGAKLAPAVLSYQLFLERLLVRAWAAAQ